MSHRDGEVSEEVRRDAHTPTLRRLENATKFPTLLKLVERVGATSFSRSSTKLSVVYNRHKWCANVMPTANSLHCAPGLSVLGCIPFVILVLISSWTSNIALFILFWLLSCVSVLVLLININCTCLVLQSIPCRWNFIWICHQVAEYLWRISSETIFVISSIVKMLGSLWSRE